MLKQPDYLGDVGRVPRLISAVVLGAFALLFSVMTLGTAVAAVTLAAQGEWDTAPVVAGSGAGCGLFAAGLIWMTRRVLRGGGAAGKPAVFPLWFIQVVGVLLLPGSVAAAWAGVNQGGGAGVARGAVFVLGPPVAMILVPWLARRRARGTGPTAAPPADGGARRGPAVTS